MDTEQIQDFGLVDWWIVGKRAGNHQSIYPHIQSSGLVLIGG